MSLGFVAFIYGFVRQWVTRAGPAAAGVLGGLIFTSFEGSERLFVLWRDGVSLIT